MHIHLSLLLLRYIDYFFFFFFFFFPHNCLHMEYTDISFRSSDWFTPSLSSSYSTSSSSFFPFSTWYRLSTSHNSVHTIRREGKVSSTSPRREEGNETHTHCSTSHNIPKAKPGLQQRQKEGDDKQTPLHHRIQMKNQKFRSNSEQLRMQS